MKIINHRYFNLILHGLAWSIVLFFPYLISSANDQYRIGPIPGLYFTLSGIIHMILFYANALFLYPKFLNKAYWLFYIAAVILLVFISVQMKLYLLERWFPNDLHDVRSHVLFPSVIAFIVSVFYSIAADRILAEKMQKENAAMQLEMELKFLRSQISPHFLFNVLTNLVALARKKSDHLETSLLMLSGLMRYMLYEVDKKISLLQEAEYLESYIALQKLRFGQDVKVIFNQHLPLEETSYGIEPMLLIPFVENAFKHGISYVDQPFIEVDLTLKERVLIFQVMNKYEGEISGIKEESSGIGLSNVCSRLTLLYPDRHELVIHSGNNLFRINLTLKL